MVAIPTKSAAGVKRTFVPEMLAVPLVGLTVIIVSVSPSTSLSLASAWMVTDTSSTVLVTSLTATGGSLSALTVTVISALAVPPLPSPTGQPSVLSPTKSAAGVKRTFVPEMTAVPLVGLTVVMVSVSPSTSLSLASAWMVTDTSSTVLVTSLTATGGSLSALTVTVISALAVPPLPSLMV